MKFIFKRVRDTRVPLRVRAAQDLVPLSRPRFLGKIRSTPETLGHFFRLNRVFYHYYTTTLLLLIITAL